jgi:hypothetical protein
MFYGALAHVTPGLEPHDEDGFVIITAASDHVTTVGRLCLPGAS